MKEKLEEEYDFDNWTTLELFYHLVDIGLIPFEENFNDWRFLKEEMLRMCKESYDRQRKN